MTPGARLAAAIEIVDAVIAAAAAEGAAADRIVADYFRSRRYAGSKDRRAVRELVWRAVRRFGDPPPSGRAAFATLADEDAALAPLFSGEGHAPAPLRAEEPRAVGGAVPGWLVGELEEPDVGLDLDALLERAPLDIRVNALKADREEIAVLWPDAEPLADALHGLRLPTGTPVERSEAWNDGRVEVQDHGSQLIVRACHAAPDMTVLDLCAGAGGKALALATEMGGKGQLVASDTNRARLSRLTPRAERAGAGNIAARLLDPGREMELLADLREACDLVLVDAPCSGTGTWRRNPETRWRLTPARLDRLVAQQAELLALAAGLVKAGGALVYAVCALTRREGREQAEAFLDRHAGWRAGDSGVAPGRAAGPGRLLTPGHDGCDGFFFARLEKIA